MTDREQRSMQGGNGGEGRGRERGMQQGNGGERRGQERGMQRGDGGARREQERGLERAGEHRGALTRAGLLQPFSLLQEIDRAFGFGSLLPSSMFGRSMQAIEEFLPTTDVYIDGDTLVVKADLPGMQKDDVEVTIDDNGNLVVSGERRHESEVDRRNMYRAERAYGMFCRRVPLPENADPEHIEAHFRDGVLEVMVPLREEPTEHGRRIEVT